MAGDLPDYTKQITVLLQAEILSQVRQLPWWVRYSPKQVLYLDDFEGVLKWEQTGGTVAKESSISAFEGSNCLTLTTGAAADSTSWAALYLGGVTRSKMAIQLRWNVYNADVEALRYFYVNLILKDGSYVSEAAVRYVNWVTSSQKKWQYLNESSAYADIPNGDENIETDYRRHQHLYLVIDFSDAVLRYKRLVTSKLDLDLSDLRFNHYAAVEPLSLQINLGVETDKAVAVKAAVDAVLLSDEEP